MKRADWETRLCEGRYRTVGRGGTRHLLRQKRLKTLKGKEQVWRENKELGEDETWK